MFNLENANFKSQVKYFLKQSRYRTWNTNRSYRSTILNAMNLIQYEFHLKHLKNLKQKHINFVIEDWMKQGFTENYLCNKMSHLRRFLRAINKQSIILKNKDYCIQKQNNRFVDKRWNLTRSEDIKLIDKVAECGHKFAVNIKDALKLQRHFGLRRREALLFRIAQIQLDHNGTMSGINVTNGAKNRRYRFVKISYQEQRDFLNEIISRYETAIMPENLTWRQIERIYHYILYKNGLSKGHGLRQGYANDRLESLKKELSMKFKALNPNVSEKTILIETYKIVSEELGHSRIEILVSYIESYKQ